MSFTAIAILFAAAMFAGVLVSLELGRWLGAKRHARAPDTTDGAAAPVVGAVFALFGLLIAFSFSGAAARLDKRREQIVVEANAIGTAYLRIDLLPAEMQPALRTLFRQYVETRIASFHKLPDVGAAKAEFDRSVALQGEIWNKALPAARSTGNPAVLALVVTALNEMIDITTSRLAALRTHQPTGISAMLVALAVAASLIAGYSLGVSAYRGWFHALMFAAVIGGSLYVILDVEYPRFGLIRIHAADQLLIELLEGMK